MSNKRWINTRVVYDMATDTVLEIDGYWHEGDVAECGGGGGGKGGKSTPKPPAPPEPEPMPSYEEEGEPTSKAIRDEEARRIRARRGANGTVLTSMMGVEGGDLLGG